MKILKSKIYIFEILTFNLTLTLALTLALAQSGNLSCKCGTIRRKVMLHDTPEQYVTLHHIQLHAEHHITLHPEHYILHISSIPRLKPPFYSKFLKTRGFQLRDFLSKSVCRIPIFCKNMCNLFPQNKESFS